MPSPPSPPPLSQQESLERLQQIYLHQRAEEEAAVAVAR